MPSLLLGLGAATCASAAPLGIVTILEGEATLLRGLNRHELVEGVRIESEDIVETGDKGRLLNLEFSDGSSLELGPNTRAQLTPPMKDGPRIYLLQGWAKLRAAGANATVLSSPWFEITGRNATALLSVTSNGAGVFVESGKPVLRPSRQQPAAAPVTMESGEFVSWTSTARLETSSRHPSAFIQAAPKEFLNSLPSRAARFRDTDVAPKRVADTGYADVQAWLDAEPALRRANLARWTPLARNAEFRKGLLAGLDAHPEWRPILIPPPKAPALRASAPRSSASAAASS